MSDKLRALVASAQTNKYQFTDERDPTLLETFKAPAFNYVDQMSLWLHITAPEFTCLCPATGQPDFATIEVLYRPFERCVESKSLKLYLMSYRNVGMFHERAVSYMLQDLCAAMTPLWCLVVGRFAARGGIPFHPRAAFGDVPSELLWSTRA